MRKLSDLPGGLRPLLANGGMVKQIDDHTWRLALPSGSRGRYRLAQLDDYSRLPRGSFPWQPPFSLSLRARASERDIPGTWGFGLWNDPFSMGILGGDGLLRLPTLPNTAWFFFASPPNYLSLRDDLPGQGGLAATFRSSRWPTLLLAPGVLLLPLLALPPGARFLRRLARCLTRQEATALTIDPTAWHEYYIEWKPEAVDLTIDGVTWLSTALTPRGRLGLVIWIDNQYMSFTPNGHVGYGTLPNPQPAWIEIADLRFSALDNHLTYV
jgi:hypothetical protein